VRFGEIQDHKLLKIPRVKGRNHISENSKRSVRTWSWELYDSTKKL